MPLPHVQNQWTFPIDQAVRKALDDSPTEFELLCSESGLDEIAGDDGEYLFEVSDIYGQRYQEMITKITKTVGAGFPWRTTGGVGMGRYAGNRTDI